MFEYQTNLNSVINVLRDHNTTTASPDLSANLSVIVPRTTSSITINDPEVTSMARHEMSRIMVRIANSEDNFDGLGLTGPSGVRKKKKVTYEVFGFIRKNGATTQHTDLLQDAYDLARNIEGVFQAEMRLSNTALWCNPVRTDFSPAVGGDQFLLKGVLLQLEAVYHFQ